jgi:hypothetical protein
MKLFHVGEKKKCPHIILCLLSKGGQTVEAKYEPILY